MVAGRTADESARFPKKTYPAAKPWAECDAEQEIVEPTGGNGITDDNDRTDCGTTGWSEFEPATASAPLAFMRRHEALLVAGTGPLENLDLFARELAQARIVKPSQDVVHPRVLVCILAAKVLILLPVLTLSMFDEHALAIRIAVVDLLEQIQSGAMDVIA
jgi:hypothetical protein